MKSTYYIILGIMLIIISHEIINNSINIIPYTILFAILGTTFLVDAMG